MANLSDYPFVMNIWDVEAGSASYIQASNRDVVIDCGASDFSPLEWIHNAYDVENIDYLSISHPHFDHIRDLSSFRQLGLESTALQSGPSTLISRPRKAAPVIENELEEAYQRGDSKYIEAAECYMYFHNNYTTTPIVCPDDPNWANGILIHDITPGDPCPNEDSYRRLNNMSVINVVECFGMKLVIPGDIMEEGIDSVLSDEENKDLLQDADVLVAPHHGRKSSYHSEFVDHIDPDLVIFSDKKDKGNNDNRYGKAPSGMRVFNERADEWDTGRKVLTTRNDGRIRIIADDNGNWTVSYYRHFSDEVSD